MYFETLYTNSLFLLHGLHLYIFYSESFSSIANNAPDGFPIAAMRLMDGLKSNLLIPQLEVIYVLLAWFPFICYLLYL